MPQRRLAHEMCYCRDMVCTLHLVTYIHYLVHKHNHEHVCIHIIYSTMAPKSINWHV